MLEVQKATFKYKNSNVDAINDISFKANNNICVLLGPNGSGKTTLIKAITGLIKLASGDILINGKSLNDLKIKERAKMIAYVKQNDNMENMNVYDNLMLGRLHSFNIYPKAKDYQKIDKVMEELGLTHLQNKNMQELSGGQRQLVLIARSLVQDADIIIFDEPTSSLDIKSEKIILDEALKLVQKYHKTILIAIHNLDLALNYGDQFLVLKEGTLIDSFTKDQINPQALSTAFDLDLQLDIINNRNIISIK